MSGPTAALQRERRIVRVTNFRAKEYWLGNTGWIVYFVAPIVPGWLISRIFDEYQRNGASTAIAPLIIALTLTELAIVWGLAVVHRRYMRACEAAKALIRANVIDAQLASGGPTAGRRDAPVGDVLVRMRDDPFDMIFLLDNWVDLVGALLYGSIAAVLLVQIDPLAALAGSDG